jgi:predicted ribosome quality control (RQC) complex YloA/Tae2 family protein
MMFHLRYKVQDAPFRMMFRSHAWLGARIQRLGIGSSFARNFIIHCQMLLSEDLHIALTSATNQPRENTETWLNSLESLPELDPDSERMLQFNQVYNRFASTLSEDSICSSKYIKEASPTIPTKATPAESEVEEYWEWKRKKYQQTFGSNNDPTFDSSGYTNETISHTNFDKDDTIVSQILCTF